MIENKQNRETGLIIALIVLFTNNYFGEFGSEILGCVLLTTLFAPFLFNPLTILFVLVGEIMGKWSTKLILVLVFYLILVPLAILSRFFSGNRIKLYKFRKKERSYFTICCNQFNGHDLNKQY